MPITDTASFLRNVIIADAIGAPGAPGGYFAFANALGTQISSTGPRIYALSASPNGVLVAPAGSIAQVTTGQLWVNTTGLSVWLRLF